MLENGDGKYLIDNILDKARGTVMTFRGNETVVSQVHLQITLTIISVIE